VSEMFGYLRDGACCTLVLVKADAKAVAQALGEPVPVADGKRGLACAIGSTGWTRVELNPAGDIGVEHEALKGYEAIVLLNEAVPITRGQVPTTPPCHETPVSTAAMLSQKFETDAVGIWASDQGPGIGGVAQFSSGKPTAVISTLDPDRLEALRKVHASDDDDTDVDEFDDEERHYLWPQAEYADGEFDEAGDARVAALGFDLELLTEPLWALVEGDQPDDSLSECYGIT